MESPKILCDVCGASFTMNKNLMRHVREQHQGIKRTKKSQELAEAKRAKIDSTVTVEVIIPDTATEDKLSKEQFQGGDCGACLKDALRRTRTDLLDDRRHQTHAATGRKDLWTVCIRIYKE